MSKFQDATTLPIGQAMRSMIQRVATGPELSKDLNEAEAELGMRLILEGTATPVEAAIFLIALRMKRETAQENRGVLSAVRGATHRGLADVDELIDIADPYDGFNRTLPSSPFLPAVLAACGLSAVSHGVDSMGPKYGVTHARVLKASGIDVDVSVDGAVANIESHGWSYVDQSQFCPSLFGLKALRTEMVKRPVITTVEVLAGPIAARGSTHLMTGYVHKPYPPIYSMLARHAGFDSCVLVRGVEGGVIPSLRQPGRMVHFFGEGEDEALALDPAALQINSEQRAPLLPGGLTAVEPADGIGMTVDAGEVAEAAVEQGLAALSGAAGDVRDSLIYAGAIALFHTRKYDDLVAAATTVRAALDNGSALERFNAVRRAP